MSTKDKLIITDNTVYIYSKMLGVAMLSPEKISLCDEVKKVQEIE
jgi:hypothetical protein